MKLVLLAGLLIAQAGCATVFGLADTEEEQFRSKIFVGVRYGHWAITSGGDDGYLAIFAPCWAVDLWPSLALDVALLPFTLIYELLRPTPEPKATSPSCGRSVRSRRGSARASGR